MRIALAAAAALALTTAGCSGLLTKSIASNFGPTRAVPNKVTHPLRADARLAVLWVGHATALVQIDDKVILTDPVFTRTVGVLSKRLVERGLDPESLPPIDAVVISHMHFDHLSQTSLDTIARKTRHIVTPKGGIVYLPDSAVPATELSTWQRWEDGGLTITAVPVTHVGWRYGIDAAWMTESFTGYVFQYHGLTVYFGGDTAYDEAKLAATAARFPSIDLALLPIAPIHPRGFMRRNHVDPFEAVHAFLDLGARQMVPIHFDTFVNSLDEPGEAKRTLARVKDGARLGDDRIVVLEIGEQRVLIPR